MILLDTHTWLWLLHDPTQLSDPAQTIITEAEKKQLLSLSNIDIFSFPTKHHWRERSDLTLIITSAQTLRKIALTKPDCTFVVTKPGCGLGGLSWSEVKNAISPILPDNCWIIDL